LKTNELKNYDFHDSLLENISFDEKTKKLRLDIDFCNWKQKNYVDGDAETYMIALVFERFFSATIPEIKLNSDQIVGFNVTDNQKVKIEAYNDVVKDCYSVIINAKEVEIVVV